MFDDLFKKFGNDPIFQEIIVKMAENAIMQVNNDLKFGELDINDNVVGATLLMCIKDYSNIEFLRTLNLRLNSNDETAYGNVNMFLNKLGEMYLEAENKRDNLIKERGVDL